jgi:hypothetical protein
LSINLSTGMTGISLHMLWFLTSKLHSLILRENMSNLIFNIVFF